MGTKVILVVDDEQEIVEVLVYLLLEAGYVVHRAGDGEDALDVLKRTPVDLVLTDFMMPKMGGDGLLDAIRSSEHLADTPVIVTSALPEEAVRSCCGSQDAFVAKPFSAWRVLATVHGLLGGSEGGQAPRGHSGGSSLVG